MIGGAEADFLRQRKTQHHPRLGIGGERQPRGAVDQIVEIGNAPQGLPGNGEGEALIGGRKARSALRRSLERLPPAKNAIEHAQRGGARGQTAGAVRFVGRGWCRGRGGTWHRRL